MAGKIVEAYAQWDDPHAFRVYLIREDEDIEDSDAMAAVYINDGTIESRLYRAAVVTCPKDALFGKVERGPLGWPREAQAKRVAKAINAELARIEKGEPGPSDMAIQFALARVKKTRR